MMRSPLSSPAIRPASTAVNHQSAVGHIDTHSPALPQRLPEVPRRSSASPDPIDEGERHRVQQLHELLDSPVVPSRVPHFMSQSLRTESPLHHTPRSGSSASNQHLRTQSADVIPMSSSLGRTNHHSSRARSSTVVESTRSSSHSRSNVHPPMVYPQQALDTPNTSYAIFHPPMLPPSQTSSGTPPHGSVRSHPGLIRHDSHRKMSSASSAAQAIEREQKERRKAEREKEKEQERLFKEREEREREAALAEKERERESARQQMQQQQHQRTSVGATSSSLRDSTNSTHGPSQQHNRHTPYPGIGNGKGRMGMLGVPPPTNVGYV